MPDAILVSPTLHLSSTHGLFNFTEEDSMTYFRRLTITGLMGLWVLVLAATSQAQTRPAIADQIAKTYSVDSWGQIEAIRYTWNGEIPGVFKLAHSWIWEPK